MEKAGGGSKAEPCTKCHYHTDTCRTCPRNDCREKDALGSGLWALSLENGEVLLPQVPPTRAPTPPVAGSGEDLQPKGLLVA